MIIYKSLQIIWSITICITKIHQNDNYDMMLSDDVAPAPRKRRCELILLTREIHHTSYVKLEAMILILHI